MATLVKTFARVARTISGNSPQVLTFPEAASQTFKAGDWVYLNAGYVTVLSSNPALILGIAAEPAHNGSAGAYNVGVFVANSDTIFEINKTDSGGTVAVTAVTDVGRSDIGLVIGAGTYSGAYINAGGNARFMCLDLSNFDTVGDTGGRLLVMVKGYYRQLFSTS